MRILRFGTETTLDTYELHPLITILQGVSLDRQMDVLTSIRSLASGSSLGVQGLVEHEGLLLELDGFAKDGFAPIEAASEVIRYVGSGSSAEETFQAEIAFLQHKVDIAAITLEELRSDLDLSAKAELFAAKRMLAFHQGEEGALRGLSSSEKKVDAVQRSLKKVYETDPVIYHVPEEVVPLLASWEQYRSRKQQVDVRLSVPLAKLEELDYSLAEAQTNLRRVREDSKPVLLSAEEELRLEVLSDPESDLTRKGRWRTQLSDEEEIELRELLNKVGVHSWTEYSLFRLSPELTPRQKKQLQEAKSFYEEILAETVVAREEIERDEEKRSVDQELAELRTEAQSFFGVMVPSDLGSALGNARQEIENPDWIDAVTNLRDVLRSNEVTPPGELSSKSIVSWAESWVHKQEEVTDRTDYAIDEIAVEDVEKRVRNAEKRLARHARALQRISSVEKDYLEKFSLLKNMRSRSSEENYEDGYSRDEIEKDVLATVGRILSGTDGSFPLVLVSDFESISSSEVVDLLDFFSEISQQLQLLIITDRREVLDWAHQIGLEKADVVVERTKVRA